MADKLKLIDANSLCAKIVQSIHDAEEWINEAKEQQDTHGLRCATEAKTSLLAMLARIHDEPTIEAEPVKHGRWKITEDVLSYEGRFDFIGCSKCGKGFLDDLCQNNGADFVSVKNDFLFCPFCGAKMDVIYQDDKIKAVKVVGWEEEK